MRTAISTIVIIFSFFISSLAFLSIIPNITGNTFAQTCNGGGYYDIGQFTCIRDIFNRYSCEIIYTTNYSQCLDLGGTGCRRTADWNNSNGCTIANSAVPPTCVANLLGDNLGNYTTAGCYLCYWRPAIWNAYTNKFEYQPGETIFFTGVAGNNHCEPGSATLSMNPGGSFGISLGAYGSASRTVSFSRSAYGNYSATACFGGSCMSDTFHICGVVPSVTAFSLNKSQYQPGENIVATISVTNTDCRAGNVTISVGGVSTTRFMGGRTSTTVTLTFRDTRENQWHTAVATATGLNGSSSRSATYFICGFIPSMAGFTLNGDQRYQTGELITATVTVRNSGCKIVNTGSVVVSDAQGSITINVPVGANTTGTATGSFRRFIAAYLTSTARIASSSLSRPYTVAGRVSGRVFRDYGRDGGFTTGDEYHQGAVVRAANASDTTDANGFFDVLNIDPGTHPVTLTLPTGYRATTPNPVSRGFGPDQTLNFGIVGRYTIAGNVFIDLNLDRQKLGSEVNYTFPGYVPDIRISASGVPAYVSRFVTTNANGTYFINNVPAGNFTISYNNVPRADEYFIYHPRNGPPPAFSLTLGNTCVTGLPTPGGTCSGDNLQNLNFGIHRARPWVQVAGGGVRMDNGWSNPIPRSALAACGGPNALVPGAAQNNPGVFYSGDTASFFNQGQASADPYNFSAGGGSYEEAHRTGSTGTLRTSYSYVMGSLQKNKQTPANLATAAGGCSDLNNCTPSTLAGGVYRANGTTRFVGNTTFGANDYVILINGDLRIFGTIRVAPGGSVMFVAAGDIFVDRAVGAAPSCSATPQLQGIYSADRNFIIDGINNCVTGVDQTLTMEGSVIANASQLGGGLQMRRNVCDFNFDYPSFRVLKNLSYILNVSDLLWVENNIWQEVAP